ncbi:hypothetical protein XarbCFBP8149_14985 [Xanthomonas arboricola]|nr:hypothetical protein XarbCFBP8149_14985 [Xanthomonas arboricola]
MRGALAARGTRRESGSGGSVAASMSPHGPAIGEGTAPDSLPAALLKALRNETTTSEGPRPLSVSRPDAAWMRRQRLCKDVLVAACPARVDGPGPCSQGAGQPACSSPA